MYIVTRIKNDMGVAIRIPPDTEKSNIIRIEGNPEGVALAKKELLDMVAKMVCLCNNKNGILYRICNR